MKTEKRSWVSDVGYMTQLKWLHKFRCANGKWVLLFRFFFRYVSQRAWMMTIAWGFCAYWSWFAILNCNVVSMTFLNFQNANLTSHDDYQMSHSFNGTPHLKSKPQIMLLLVDFSSIFLQLWINGSRHTDFHLSSLTCRFSDSSHSA